VIDLLGAHPLLSIGLSIPVFIAFSGVLYLTVRYTPVVSRHFQAQPLFVPLKVTADEIGESAEFATDDGLVLRGSYLRGRARSQTGVIVFCHEYLSDRWSFRPYVDDLRDLGYDVFTFDFRNHGESDHETSYAPMQWTTDREVRDLRAALRYLRTRPDHDPAGFGLFGVSRGGTTALLAAAGERDVWGVVTDGAFPTSGTMVPYIIRWAEIYVRSPLVRKLVPAWVYRVIGWSARRRTERFLNCRFPSVESAVARLGPRPWLMIHGEADAYIGPEIARGLFEYGRDPKELWLVPKAKHNRCRETDPQAYASRLGDFLERFAPRRPLTVAARAASSERALSATYSHELVPAELARGVASPISG
jgi:pimeloyl-ACP methyl ester carboxylesterase